MFSLERLIIDLPVLLMSAVLHEFMHGWVANKLGDPTARLLGRLTLNPKPHIDPVSSLLLPLILILARSPIIFGAAKPVPVNPIHFHDPKKDMAIVALAGPFTNIALAIAGAIFIQIIPFRIELVDTILISIITYNLLLAIINLIPIPPLDGSKFIASLLPNNIAASYLSVGEYGTFILLFLLLFPMGGFSLSDLLGQLMRYSLTILGF